MAYLAGTLPFAGVYAQACICLEPWRSCRRCCLRRRERACAGCGTCSARPWHCSAALCICFAACKTHQPWASSLVTASCVRGDTKYGDGRARSEQQHKPVRKSGCLQCFNGKQLQSHKYGHSPQSQHNCDLHSAHMCIWLTSSGHVHGMGSCCMLQ